MNTNRGIFESFPNQPGTRQDSPFAVVPEAPPAPAAASPFTAVARQDSPFMVVDDAAEPRTMEPNRPARLPERRKIDSPFQAVEPPESFGFEAAPQAYSAAPFETPPAPAAAVPSPFSAPAQAVAVSPFSTEPLRAASPTTQAALATFGNWQEPQVAVPQAFAHPTPAVFAAAPAAAPPQAVQLPSAFSTPAPQAALVVPTPVASDEIHSDSFSIRQLELRAIFGVDREMNPEEILQRSRALPGMRNIARVSPQDMNTVESLKNLLPNLGFGSGGLKLYSGSVPLEFVREGPVMLAAQTDGGFAPGVRETLMIVARELGRLS